MLDRDTRTGTGPHAAPHVAVLGAGIQGSTIALELAARGCRVTLFDREDRAITGASRWNEGKIHLGHIFANDPSLRTARRMARGAAIFAPFLSRWMPRAVFDTEMSDPFAYLTMADSLLDADALADRYARIDAIVAEEMAQTGRFYLGQAPLLPTARLGETDLRDIAPSDAVAAGFATPERALDTALIARNLRAALADVAGITCRFGTEINAVRRDGDRFTIVTGDGEDGPYDAAVNALWSDRMAIDATLGITTARPHLFRRKLATHLGGTPALRLPSVTMVLGPYGDIVALPGGGYYLSWYPDGCIAMTDALSPPPDWRGPPDEATSRRLLESTVTRLDALVPGVADVVAQARDVAIDGGAIFAWGAEDIDVSASELHERHDVGVTSFDGYHSVDTGKYSLAPLHALALADRIVPP